MSNEILNFTSEVIEKLEYYVYRLVDPRNGETFYVGKGKGNRVFHHVRKEKQYIEDYDEVSLKIKTIKQIEDADLQVIHIIHMHGMNEKTAKAVEAALIDAYPGLTNIMSGSGANDYGVANVKQIIDNYSAAEAIFEDKCLVIKINQTFNEDNLSLYEATRFAWRIDVHRARRADYVLAVSQGIIRGVFLVNEWLAATETNFPGRPNIPDRFGFVGEEAPKTISDKYIKKRIPQKYRSKGASNPIMYSYK